jgi:raffinose/stachyose/melibiose transport system substrate-binding protein
MMRKLAYVFAVLMAVVLLFTGCGGGSAGGGDKIEISFLNKYPEDEYRPYFEQAIKDFETNHPGVTIKMESVSDHAIKDKLSIIAGSDIPDIFFTWPGEYQRKFDRAGITLDLTPYLEADPEWRDSFIPAILQTGVFQDRNHSIPFRDSIMFVLYNKDMFNQYGLTPPEDFGEFLTVCETLKANGETPLLFGNSGEWYGSWYVGTFNQLCVPFEIKMRDYAPGGGEFTHPGYERALQYIYELQTRGYFSPHVLSVDYYQVREQFCAGQGGMILDATSQFVIYEQNSVMEWDFFKVPGIPGEAGKPDYITGGAEAYCIAATTKYPDMAVEFLKFLTSPKQAYKQTAETGLPNPLIGGIDSGNGSSKLISAMKILEDYKGIAAWLDTDVEAKVADAFMAGLSECLGGNKSPAGVMADVRKAAAEVRESL